MKVIIETDEKEAGVIIRALYEVRTAYPNDVANNIQARNLTARVRRAVKDAKNANRKPADMDSFRKTLKAELDAGTLLAAIE